MNIMPHEIALSDVYFPPLLLVGITAYFLAALFTSIATKLGWYKYVVCPAVVEFAFMIIFIGVLSQFVYIF
ncbi:DUF1656 domain-containing protein [Shewanella sp. c952]|uniref:DUF1656 domain-containing protein n=1 Tax=Shewanella sp. c952 TaxID=2815913 RepID=UPI001BB86E62|nr:DUF1656 domain-containing protein [Shewanella sp. c952]GIU12450.1 DUF1656 domain-containing protein [Shewanella sp. c952]